MKMDNFTAWCNRPEALWPTKTNRTAKPIGPYPFEADTLGHASTRNRSRTCVQPDAVIGFGQSRVEWAEYQKRDALRRAKRQAEKRIFSEAELDAVIAKRHLQNDIAAAVKSQDWDRLDALVRKGVSNGIT